MIYCFYPKHKAELVYSWNTETGELSLPGQEIKKYIGKNTHLYELLLTLLQDKKVLKSKLEVSRNPDQAGRELRNTVLDLKKALELSKEDFKHVVISMRGCGYQWVAIFVQPERPWKKTVMPIQKLSMSIMELLGDDSILDELEQNYNQDAIKVSRPLSELQRGLYRTLDEAKIKRVSDYNKLNSRDKGTIAKQITISLVGLDCNPASLLELSRINTRFHTEDFKMKEMQLNLTSLHSKTALYSDHSVAEISKIEIPHAYNNANYFDINDDLIHMLLVNRPLIENGKMSVVPNSVSWIKNHELRCFFKISQLETIKVDLKDQIIRSDFLEIDPNIRHQGHIFLDIPTSSTFSLEWILEIQNQFQSSFKEFQNDLRSMLVGLKLENDTAKMKEIIAKTHLGIRDLDSKFEKYLPKNKSECIQSCSSIGISLYGLNSEFISFLKESFQESSSIFRLIEKGNRLPEELVKDKYFLPWLIYRKFSEENRDSE